MDSRRKFIGKVASGLAGTLATSNVLGANDRIRLGIVGAGDRGQQLMREAAACGAEVTGIADAFTRRLDQAKAITPSARTHLDYRHLLEDKDIDAIVVATPQHLHGEHFVAALDAGKHVYQEKTMAFTVEQAKRMREGVPAGRRQAHGPGRPPTLFIRTAYGCRPVPPGQLLGKISAIRSLYVPQHPPWQAAVGPTRVPGHHAGYSALEILPGRGARLRLRRPPLRELAFLLGLLRRQRHENMWQQISFWYKVLDLKIRAR